MTRDDIIRMAVEAGGHVSGFGDRWVMYTQDLEHFAALVAAAEGIACEEIVSLCCGSCAEAIRARREPIRARGLE